MILMTENEIQQV